MAYDPKSYLEQALQQGFESVYSQPSSLETGEAPQYQGDVATFGDVQVRPMTIGGTEDAPEYGHMVSVPLTGQYQGYFRNDIYDSQGNFVKTTISEPADSGFKDLAQIGLMALSGGMLGPTGQLFSKGIGALGALQSGDPLRILGAATGMPGAGNYIPAELKTIADYAGKAGQVASALKGDPSAIFSLISGADKSGALSGKAASAGYGGADLGFFDPEAEALAQEGIQSIVARYPDAGNLPSWALDPYKDEPVDWASLYSQPTTNPATGQTIVGAAQSGYPAQTFGTAPQSDINAVYDSIVRDRGGFASTWQTVGSDRVMVQDDGSAIGINTETGENYVLTPEETKRMVDAGLLNTAASGYNAAIGKSPGSAPAGKTPSKQDPYKQAMDTLALMQGQRPEEEEYELFNAKPFGYDLMYGLKG